MKRSAELRDLSEDHHRGLIQARHLRLACAGRRAVDRTVAEFLAAWRDELGPHFRAEEEVLLPHFAGAAPVDDPLIVRTLVEHVALRRAARSLEGASGERRRALAGELGRALEAHIRFEERELFPAVEAALAGPALAALAGELARVERRGATCAREPASRS